VLRAIFIIGFEKGLIEWRPLLTSNGYLVLSEPSWLRKDVPEELRSYMKEMYAGIESAGVRSMEKKRESAKKWALRFPVSLLFLRKAGGKIIIR
jgi:hypothetical protein